MLTLLMLMLNSCPDGDNAVNPDDSQNSEFKTENEHIYLINSSKSFSVKDSITGFIIIFPNGGNGQLKISKIISAPEIDLNQGIGFKLIYSGGDDIILQYERKPDYGPLLYTYGVPNYSQFEYIPNSKTWTSINPDDTLSNPVNFNLNNVSVPQLDSKINKNDNAYFQKRTNTALYLYFTNELKVNNWAWKRIDVLKTITYDVINSIQQHLGPNLKSIVKSRLNESTYKLNSIKPAFSSGLCVESYSGLNLGMPYICYDVYTTFLSPTYATESAASHEVGHYISFLLLGSAEYKILSAQKKSVHFIGEFNADRPILEEWAHWADYLTNGIIARGSDNNKINGDYDIIEPAKSFKNSNKLNKGINKNDIHPSKYDMPSAEGFGCALMARINSTDLNTITNYDNVSQDIPIIGLASIQIYDLLSKNPKNINELYKLFENYFALPDEKTKLAVIAQRCGWSYFAKSKIFLENNIPLKSGKLSIYLTADGKEYLASENSINNGVCDISALFPVSKAKIRILSDDLPAEFNGKYETEVSLSNFSINLPTNKALDEIKIDIKAKSNAPEITSIEPAKGSVGQLITITGKNFLNQRNNNYVLFGGVKADSYTEWSDTKIKVYVPQLAQSGDVFVNVNNVNSNGKYFEIDMIDLLHQTKTMKIEFTFNGNYINYAENEPNFDLDHKIKLIAGSVNSPIKWTGTSCSWDYFYTDPADGSVEKVNFAASFSSDIKKMTSFTIYWSKYTPAVNAQSSSYDKEASVTLSNFELNGLFNFVKGSGTIQSVTQYDKMIFEGKPWFGYSLNKINNDNSIRIEFYK
jgi:hypothetical protein